MRRTEQIEQAFIDEVIEREREGGHPLGHRVVKMVLERTETAQAGYDGVVNE